MNQMFFEPNHSSHVFCHTSADGTSYHIWNPTKTHKRENSGNHHGSRNESHFGFVLEESFLKLYLLKPFEFILSSSLISGVNLSGKANPPRNIDIS